MGWRNDSKYRGDKWNSFYSQLPNSLVNHLNGNAVYNLTHPLLDKLVDQLESERDTTANAIPFDYRISQMIQDVQTGTAPEFPNFPDLDSPILSTPSPLSGNFRRWAIAQAYHWDNVIRDVSVIGNYAKTNMIPAFLDKAAFIIHGAKMFDSWKERNLGVSGK
jgi:hypothetical protein